MGARDVTYGRAAPARIEDTPGIRLAADLKGEFAAARRSGCPISVNKFRTPAAGVRDQFVNNLLPNTG